MSRSFDEVVNALAEIYEPTTSQERRAAAYDVCEKFKTQTPPDELMETSFEVVTTPDNVPSQLRFFGLQCLHSLTRVYWNEMPEEVRAQMSRASLNILSSSSIMNIWSRESRMLCNQLLENIVEIAKREWPQQWPDLTNAFTALLEGYTESGRSRTELLYAFVVLFGSLAELSKHTNPALPDARRRDIQNGTRTLRAVCLKSLLEAVSEIQQVVSSDESNNNNNTHNNYANAQQNGTSEGCALPDLPRAAQLALLQRCVYCVSELVESMSFDAAIADGVVEVLRGCLYVSEVSSDAMEAIIAVFMRRPKVLSIENAYSTIITVWQTASEFASIQLGTAQTLADISDDGLGKLHKSLRLLRILQQSYAEVLQTKLDKHKVHAMHAASGSLELLIKLFGGPSLMVSMEAALALVDIARAGGFGTILAPGPYLGEGGDRQALVGELMRVIKEKVLRIPYQPEEDLEFESEHKCLEMQAQVRGQALTLATLVAKLEPEFVYSMLQQDIQELYEAVCAFEAANPSPQPSSSSSFSSSSSSSSSSSAIIDLSARIFPRTVNGPIMDAPCLLFPQAEALSIICEHVLRSIEDAILTPSDPLRSAAASSSATAPSGFGNKRSNAAANLDKALVEVSSSMINNGAEFICALCTKAQQINELSFLMPLLRTVTSFYPLYTRIPEAFAVVIEFLMTVAGTDYGDCLFELDARPDWIVEIRRRACYSLLHLAQHGRATIGPVVDAMMGFFNEVSQRLTPGENTLLLEMVLGAQMSSSDDVVSINQSIESSIMEASKPCLENEDVVRYLESPQSYLQLLGCSDEEQEFFKQQLQVLENKAAASFVSYPGLSSGASASSGEPSRTFATFSSPMKMLPIVANETAASKARSAIVTMLSKVSSVMRLVSSGGLRKPGPRPNIGAKLQAPSTTTSTSTSTSTPTVDEFGMDISLSAAVSAAAASSSSSSKRGRSSSSSASHHVALAAPGLRADGIPTAEPPGGLAEPLLPCLAQLAANLVPFLRTHLLLTNRCLSSDGLTAMPPRLHVIAAPEFDQLHHLITKDCITDKGPGTMAVPTDRRSHVGRDVGTWVDQSTEYVCQILGNLTLAGPAFYETLEQEAGEWAELFDSFVGVPPRRLKVFLTRTMSAMVLRCPVNKYGSLMSKLLPSIISTIVRTYSNCTSGPEMSTSFGRLIARVRGNAGCILPEYAGAMEQEAKEEDETLATMDEQDLAELSRTAVLFLAPSLEMGRVPFKEVVATASAAVSSGGARSSVSVGSSTSSAGNNTDEAKQVELLPQVPDAPFSALVVSDGDVVDAVFALGLTMMSSADNTTSFRASRMLRHLVPFVAHVPDAYGMIGNAVVTATQRLMVETSPKEGVDSSAAEDISKLLRDIFLTFQPLSPVPLQALATVVPEAMVEALAEILTPEFADSLEGEDRKQGVVVRTFILSALRDLASENQQQNEGPGTTTAPVLNLPSVATQLLEKRQKRQADAENAGPSTPYHETVNLFK